MKMAVAAPARLILEIDVGERLPVGVADDETGVRLFAIQGGGKRRGMRTRRAECSYRSRS
jgi:hypothetical protein